MMSSLLRGATVRDAAVERERQPWPAAGSWCPPREGADNDTGHGGLPPRSDALPRLQVHLALALVGFAFLGGTSACAAPHALQFNGLSTGVQLGAPETLKVRDAITMEAWIHPTGKAFSSSTDGVILGREGEYLLARFGDGTLRWALASTTPGWNWVSSGHVVPEGRWTHVAVTYDGTRIRTYADGVLVNSVAGSGVIGDANALQNNVEIGSRGTANQSFSGMIDDVRIWGVARSESGIRTGMHHLLTGKESGLRGYWPLDEGVGNSVLDLSNQNPAGTRSSGVWVVSTAPVGIPVVDTIPVTAVSASGATAGGELAEGDSAAEGFVEWDHGITALGFDDTDDAVVIPHQDAMNGDPANGPFLTATAWVKAPPGVTGGLVNKYVSGSRNGWQMYLVNGELRAWYFFNGSSHVWGPTVWTDQNGLNGGRIDDNRWHHTAFQVDTSGGYLYVDGSLRASLRWTGTPARTTTTQPLSIGLYPSTTAAGHAYLGAVISDVGLWRTDLPGGAINDVLRGDNDYASFLVGRWPLSEGRGSVAVDVSGQGNHGILQGDPSWIPAARPPRQFARRSALQRVSSEPDSLVLDGVDDHLESTTDIDLANQSFSVEFWARRQKLGTAQSFFSQTRGVTQSASFANRGLHLGWRPSNVFTFAFFSNDLDTPQAWTDLDWHHWACTYDRATARRRILRDGIVVAEDTPSLPYQGSGPVWLGLRDFSPADDWGFPGEMREVRVWGTALDPATIRRWSPGPVGPDHPDLASLKAYWPLADAGAATAPDRSPARNALRLVPATDAGGPVPRRRGSFEQSLVGLDPGTGYLVRAGGTNAYGMAHGEPRVFTTHAGPAGTALEFDGFDDGAAIGPFAGLALTNTLTLEAWVYPVGLSTGLEVLLIREGEYGLSRTAEGRLQVALANTSPGWSWIPSTAVIPPRVWTHLAAAYDGNEVRFYTNGMSAGTAVARGPIRDTRPEINTLDLAGTPVTPAQAFAGALDEIRIWRVARSGPEVARDFNLRLTGHESGLVACYRMDEGSGDSLQDAGPNGFHGRHHHGARWVPSGATVGRPQVTTLSAADVAFGTPRLEGEVKPAGEPVNAYFEWGPGTTWAASAASNRVDFFFPATAPSRLTNINWSATPDLTDTFYDINIASTPGAFWAGVPPDNFAARFTADLHVPTDGTYLFYLSSDDGSDLHIDGQLVVDHDGPHSMSERSGAIGLTAGVHRLEVRMFEAGGNAGLILSYAGPGFAKQVVPAASFQIREPVYGETTGLVPLAGAPVSQRVSVELPPLPVGTYQYRLVTRDSTGLIHGGNRTFLVTRPAAGSAIRLDGIDDYVQVGSDAATKFTSAFTLEAWIQPLGLGRGGMIINREGEYELARDGNGELWWAVENGGRWVVNRSGAFTPEGQWSHVALVYASGTVRLYLNGDLVHTSAGSGNLGDRFPAANEVRIGSREIGGSPFDGLIDDVRFWSIALTETDIRGRMHAWLSGTESGLRVYLRFNEGTGLTSRNLAGSPDGILVNGATWAVSGIDPQIPPLLGDAGALPVLATSATLTGWVNPANSETVAWFTWWPIDNPGDVRRTPNRALGSGSFNQRISESITGLSPDSTYGFQLHANSSVGSRTGNPQAFRTLLLDCGWPVAVSMSDGVSADAVHAIDRNGEVLVAGTFSGTATFGRTALVASGAGAPGRRAGFVAKLDPSGEWVWARAFEATGDLHPTSIGTSTNGSVRVAGWFSGVLTLGDQRLAGPGEASGFVLGLDAAGVGQWVVSPNGTGLSPIHAVALGADGTTTVAGSFTGALNAAGSELVSAGGEDAWAARLSPDGAWQWARRAGGPDDDRAWAVDVTEAGEVVVGGDFRATATFGATSLTSEGQGDFFLARLRGDGSAWVWAKRGGGAGEDLIADVKFDAHGNLFATGNARGAITYDGSPPKADAGNQDNLNLFVARFSGAGALGWFTRTGVARNSRLALDAGGNAHVLAEFANNLVFQTRASGTVGLVPTGNSVDLVIARLDGTSGVWEWVRQLGSPAGETAGSVVLGPDGVFSLSGSFGGAMAVGEVNLTTVDARVFLARINPDAGFEYNAWTIGRAVPVPDAAQRPDGGALRIPTVTIRAPAGANWGDYFFWSQAENRLFPIRPVELAEIAWPLSTSPTPMVLTCLGRSLWPVQPPRHVAGAPVDL